MNETKIFEKCQCDACKRRSRNTLELRDNEEHVIVHSSFLHEVRAYIEQRLPRCRCKQLAFFRIDEPGPMMKSTFVCEEHNQKPHGSSRIVPIHAQAKEILEILKKVPSL